MEMDASLTTTDFDDNHDHAFNTMPPGEEGFRLSHKGGEHEVFEDFAWDLAELTSVSRRRVDDRDWSRRVDIRNTDWDRQFDDLASAYLEFRMNADEEMSVNVPVDSFSVGQEPPGLIEIEAVDLFCE
ncbi:hypothetical protein JAAARDRAFT_56628 [Jaapia argillacea MUCL 33604]|uniref:Uncharacterized protein n=1 Tax=Jaapia argillacea MUCL 33604 TaxID=933084 RepID=A0A067QAK8_9AGAM|nr:hypothetical protein JAAARDRAFT_56628 [Jaapia argillacea MUCL 33604]